MKDFPSEVRIRAFAPEDAASFRTLNEEWISRYFKLEARDHETLGDPVRHILEPGGSILMAWMGPRQVGCCALIPFAPGVLELAKMAVIPELRGRGIGSLLLAKAIDEARGVGARSLFLGSSSKLKNAVHLYEQFGFRHLRLEEIPPMPYNRADVFMALELNP